MDTTQLERGARRIQDESRNVTRILSTYTLGNRPLQPVTTRSSPTFAVGTTPF